MTVILDQFVQTLRECGLMTAEEIDSFLEGLPEHEKPQTGEQFAKLLHRDKKLTKFQAQAVYQGKTKGLVFGNYIVLDKIGQGGMGYVYKAQHRRMKRVVALKVLPSAVAKLPDAVKRFLREVEAAARLSHPNIVTAYDADEADGIHFLVMEYVDATDLAALVRNSGPLPVDKAIDYIIQTAKGLEYAHRQHVIHRDVKPSNLLLDPSGVVKILDMGLARFEREVEAATRSDGLTQSGQVMGTIDYMSPEQSMDTHHADQRSDIYSLGCTLFYLLMGRSLYPGETLLKKILAHRDEPIPSLRAFREDVPQELDAVFQKMVAKQAKDRYSSMHDVVTHLAACSTVTPPPLTETISFQGGPTGGGDTESQLAKVATGSGNAGPAELAIDDWLVAELPSPPTLLRTLPRRQAPIKREYIVIGSVAAGVVLLLMFLGIVLRFRTSEGTLLVEVNQPNAEVTIDDGKVTINSPDDNEPVQVQVAAGKHTLLVTKGGFESFTKEFTIRSGGRETIHVELLGKKAEVVVETAKPAAATTRAPPAATPVPVAAASRATGVAPVDPQRRAAEAVLKLGGTVTVKTASSLEVAVAALKDLPAEPFALCAVSLSVW